MEQSVSSPLSHLPLSDHFVSTHEFFVELETFVKDSLCQYSTSRNLPVNLQSFKLKLQGNAEAVNDARKEAIFFELHYALANYETSYPYPKIAFERACTEACSRKILLEHPHIRFLEYVALRCDSGLVKKPKERIPQVSTIKEQKERLRMQKTAVDLSFNRDFVDKAFINFSFLDYFTRHYGKEKNEMNPELQYYAPLMPIHQSSGSGKSRLIKEVSSFLLPIVLSGPNPSGVPEGSALLDKFKNLILSQSKARLIHIDAMMTVAFNFLVKTLFHAISAKLRSLKAAVTAEGRISNFDASVRGEFFSFSIEADLAIPYNPLNGLKEYLESSLCEQLKDVNPLSPKFTDFQVLGDQIGVKQLEALFDDLRKHRILHLESIVGGTSRATELLEWLPHSLIVFDEAQGLASKLDVSVAMTIQDIFDKIQTDPFRIFRRTLRNTKFFWEYAWCVAISTNSSICNFLPTSTDDNSLSGITNVVTIPPFIYNQSFDVFARQFYSIFEGDQTVVPANALDYVYSWKRISHHLSCGRPLFWTFAEANMGPELLRLQLEQPLSVWDRKTNFAFEELVRMVVQKINGGRFGHFLEIDDIPLDVSVMYALFSASVGLYAFPEALLDKADMVRRQMSWVVSYNMDTADMEIAYPSEGIFNCILAFCLEQKLDSFLEDFDANSIMAFFSKPAAKKQFNTSQMMEILCRMLFLFAMQRTCSAHLKDEPVGPLDVDRLSLKHFKDLLYPRRVVDLLLRFSNSDQEAKEIRTFMTMLGEEYVDVLTSFGYFQEVSKAHDPLSFCKALLYRGSACYFQLSNQSGADAILPMVLQNGRYGLILIQIKGVQNNILAKAKSQFKEDRSDGISSGKYETYDGNKSKKPKTDNALDNGNSDDEFDANSYVKDKMRLCTVEGVFKFKDEKDAEKLARMRREKPCALRMIINLNSTLQPGVKCFLDEHGPILAIQTTGQLLFLKRRERGFIFKAAATAEKSWQGKMPTYEAQFMRPPVRSSNPPKAYNPSFAGILHDNDADITRGLFKDFVHNKPDEERRQEERREESSAARPGFDFKPYAYFPNLDRIL